MSAEPAEPPPPAASKLDAARLMRRVLLVTLLAVGLYGGIVLFRGLGGIAASFSSFHWWAFGAACGLSALNYLLRFLKWEFYLGVLGVRIPKHESLLVFLSGFVLTVTPGKVGEVFKSLVLQRLHGVPFERSAPIVVAERVTDLIGVIAMIAIGSLGFSGGVIWAAAGAVVVLALLVFIASPALSQRAVSLMARLPGTKRVVPKIELALAQLRELTTPIRLLWPALLSLVGWSLEGIGLWVLLTQGFGLTDVEAPRTVFFYSTATLAGALIPLPGGLGVVEELLEEQMTRLGGIPTSIATAAMLLIRLATLWFAVVLGFLALGALRLIHPGFKLADDDVRSLQPLQGVAENKDL
jgi:glycosyltransferase 2 family protein